MGTQFKVYFSAAQKNNKRILQSYVLAYYFKC